LRSLPVILPVLDFSTIKNELFPIIASVFSKTSSLAIKVRGLEAFVTLCGGSNDPASNNDGLDGMTQSMSKKSSSTALDKYTMQEKILPLIKGIKTKEPAVSIAALNVLRQIGNVADEDFVALEILPVLWGMSLGPLLDLKQFQAFMELIKNLSSRVEADRTKKLSELSGTNSTKGKGNDEFVSFGATNAFQSNGGSENTEIDFESLVKGNTARGASVNAMDTGWDAAPAKAASQSSQPSFAWSTPTPTAPTNPGSSGPAMEALRPQQGPASRTITPDLTRFDALSPTNTQFSQPLKPSPPQRQATFNAPLPQPQSSYNGPLQPQTNYTPGTFQPPPPTQPFQSFQPPQSTVNWGAVASQPWAINNAPSSNPPLAGLGNSMSNLSMNQPRPAMVSQSSTFSLPPPPAAPNYSSFGTAPSTAFVTQTQTKPPAQKSGLDAFESLL
jgi:SCY1-like protein 2